MLKLKNSVVLVKNLITKAGQIVPNFTNHRCKCRQEFYVNRVCVRHAVIKLKKPIPIT